MDERGCTANVILIVPENSELKTPAIIVCANAGDSRSGASVSGKSLGLSFDHKPTNATERTRI